MKIAISYIGILFVQLVTFALLIFAHTWYIDVLSILVRYWDFWLFIVILLGTVIFSYKGYFFSTIRKLYENPISLTKNLSRILMIYLLLYFAFFVGLAYWEHINLTSAIFDLGTQEQVIWNTSHGRWFASSPEVTNYLGDHISLILIPIAIIYRIFPYTITLLSLQTLAVVLAIWGIYRLSIKKTKSQMTSFVIAVTFSTFWGISGLMLFDFHAISFALPILIWGIYFLESENNYIGMLLLLFALITREDVGIFIGSLGLYYILTKRYKIGILLTGVGYTFSLFALLIAIPYFRGGPSDTLVRYANLGDEPKEIVKTILTKPFTLLKEISHQYKKVYLSRLFLPTFPFWAFAPLAFLVLLPSLLINLLSNSFFQNSALYQYDVMTTVGIFFATILGTTFFLQNKRIQLAYKHKIILFLIILIPINFLMLLGHPAWYKIGHIENRLNDYRALQVLKHSIPDNAIVASSNNLGSHISQRQGLYVIDPYWMVNVPDAELDYVLIDNQTCCVDYALARINQWLESEVLFELDTKGNITLYKFADNR